MKSVDGAQSIPRIRDRFRRGFAITVSGQLPPVIVGHVLTAHLMGLESTWNHPAIFDYYDRFLAIDGSLVADGPNAIHEFVDSMWTSYRSLGPN